jgi:hypothetical protein
VQSLEEISEHELLFVQIPVPSLAKPFLKSDQFKKPGVEHLRESCSSYFAPDMRDAAALDNDFSREMRKSQMIRSLFHFLCASTVNPRISRY